MRQYLQCSCDGGGAGIHVEWAGLARHQHPHLVVMEAHVPGFLAAHFLPCTTLHAGMLHLEGRPLARQGVQGQLKRPTKHIGMLHKWCNQQALKQLPMQLIYL